MKLPRSDYAKAALELAIRKYPDRKIPIEEWRKHMRRSRAFVEHILRRTGWATDTADVTEATHFTLPDSIQTRRARAGYKSRPTLKQRLHGGARSRRSRSSQRLLISGDAREALNSLREMVTARTEIGVTHAQALNWLRNKLMGTDWRF